MSHGEDWSFVFEKVATMQKRTVSLGKMMLAAVGTISLITLASLIWRSANSLTGRAQNFLPRLLLSENAHPVKLGRKSGSKITGFVLGWVEDWVVRSDSRGF